MGKRFVETSLGREPWFRKLTPKIKCAVRFLFDECDITGVWIIDMETMSYFIGEEVALEELFLMNSDKENRVELFGRDKLFIPGFISFQYGTLSENCKPHRPIIEKLKKYNLYERVLKGFQKGIHTLEEKEKEKEKDKEKEQEGEVVGGVQTQQPIIQEMNDIWIIAKPDYPLNQAEDFRAYFSIGEFISKQIKSEWLPRTLDDRTRNLESWKALANWISHDEFYSTLSLSSISKIKSLQTIWQKKNKPINGTHQQPPNQVSRKNAGAHQLLSQLKQEYNV